MAKKNIEIIPEKTQNEIETSDLQLEAFSLEEQASSKFTPEFLKKLKRIAYFIANVGLTVQEACLLTDIDFEHFKEQMVLEPLIKKIINIKELQYKKDLLSTVSRKARSGDDKLAMQLLQVRYPEEYGDKKNKPTGNEDDVFFQAIEFIRSNGSNNPLINTESARSIVVKKGNAHGVFEKIGSILKPD